MEENTLARQVAEDLKRFLTASALSVREGNFDAAREYINQALLVSELIEYHAGSAMALYNLANLQIAAGDIIAALETASRALVKARQADVDVPGYEKLVHAIFLAAQKEGVKFARNKNYKQALVCFEAAAVCAPEDKKTSLEQRIILLKKVLDERHGD